MTIAYENNSQFLEGTETISLFEKDDATPVSVSNALVGELTFKESMNLGTLNVETRSIAIELDKANLAGVVPISGCKIVRDSDSTEWRVLSTPSFDHVIGVYRCLCAELK